MSNNPYTIDAPVAGEQFFGRTDLINSVRRTFETSVQNAVAIFGQRRLGKTSVLCEIANQLSNERYVVVYWGLKEQADLSFEAALASLAQAIADAAQLASPGFAQDLVAEQFSARFLPHVQQHIAPRRLVLLLDDVDILTQDENKTNNLITYIQKLIMDEQSVAFALSTSQRFQDLTIPFQRIGKQVRYEELQLLNPQEMHALITKPLIGSAINYSPETIKTIQELGGGYPYFTQLICHHSFERVQATQKTTIDRDVLKAILPDVLETSAPEFRKWLVNLSKIQMTVLSAAAAAYQATHGVVSLGSVSDELNKININGGEITQAFGALQRQKILQQLEGQDFYKFVVPLMAWWIAKAYPLHNKSKLPPYLGIVATLFVVALLGFFAFNSGIFVNETPTLVAVLTPTNTSTSTPAVEATARSDTATAEAIAATTAAQAAADMTATAEIIGTEAANTTATANAIAATTTTQAAVGATKAAEVIGVENANATATANAIATATAEAAAATAEATGDSDGDSLSNAEEENRGTNPQNPDSDSDGLDDGQEINQGTNPLNPDTDGDGVNDDQEIIWGTDPLKPDSDGDGLPDGIEIDRDLNPINPDTDGDGMLDGEDLDPQNPPTPLPEGLEILDIEVVGAGHSKTIYIVAKNTGVYQRDPSGSWSFLSADLADSNQIRTLKVRVEDGKAKTIYAGYDNGVRRWTAAEGWSSSLFPIPTVHTFVIIPDNDIVFAGTDGGVYRSVDDGLIWEPMNFRTKSNIIAVAIYGLAASREETGNWRLYAAGADSAIVFEATINPVQEAQISHLDPRWDDIPVSSECGTKEKFFAITADPADPNKIYLGNDQSRICYSENRGGDWTAKVMPVGSVAEVYITEIIVTPGNTAAYAATGNPSSNFASNGILIRDQNPQGEWIARQPPGFVVGQDYIQTITLDTDEEDLLYVGGSKNLFEFNTNADSWAESR